MKGLFIKAWAKASALAERVTKDLTDHRLLWNYLYMGLYVILALYLAFFHADSCGNAVIVTTGGVVTGIFTNVVWSKSYEKKSKESANEKHDADPGEVGASD